MINAIETIMTEVLPDGGSECYLVGGTVRDLLLGRTPVDIDLVVSGNLSNTAHQIAQKTGGKVIDLGKKTCPLLRVVSPSRTIDIAPLAACAIEENLRERDFTINAMAYDLRRQRLLDHHGGQNDLKNKRVRTVSDRAFKQDPARLVRAYRMTASLGFSITNGTRRAICRDKDLVSTVSGERIWSELANLFNAPCSAAVVREMADSRLLTAIIPELRPAIGCRQNRHHSYDVFEHALRVFDQVERLLSRPPGRCRAVDLLLRTKHLIDDLFVLKYSALLHDIGKPASRKPALDGSSRFPGHAQKSADIAAIVSRRLKLSNRHRRLSDAVIRHHLRPLFLFLAAEKKMLGRRGTVRFFRHCGERTLPILVHSMADIRAKNETVAARDKLFLTFCDRLARDYQEMASRKQATPPLINGNDLISVFGLSPSPLFSSLLHRVDEQRLAGLLTTRDEALDWVAARLAVRQKAKLPE